MNRLDQSMDDGNQNFNSKLLKLARFGGIEFYTWQKHRIKTVEELNNLRLCMSAILEDLKLKFDEIQERLDEVEAKISTIPAFVREVI